MLSPLRRVRAGWLMATLALAACSDSASPDRPDFNPPPEAAGGFVGYSDAGAKLTTCGVCHVLTNGAWAGTRHGDAYATLEESGQARDFCYGCHTVSERGNAVDEPAGWNRVQHLAYHDVQCESCHGPGSAHIAVPDGVSPLASMAVSSTTGDGCGACHNGNHHPFVEEWSQSDHAKVGFQAERDGCRDCHSGQARLVSWGIDTDYVEKFEEPLAIVCGICHDPHDREFDGQVRFPIVSNTRGDHLCTRCHDRDASPDMDQDNPKTSPHSPESGLLFGDAGWFPPNSGLEPGEILGTHGTEANPTLCTKCHLDPFTVTDPDGGFVFQATGHLFAAIPCLDEQGLPTPDDCAYTTETRTWKACTDGCHGTEQNAARALDVASTRIDAFTSILEEQLDQVPDSELDPDDGRYTVAEGSTFNVDLARQGGKVQPTTTHNPFLIESLLVASIQAVEDEYGIAPSRSLDTLIGR